MKLLSLITALILTIAASPAFARSGAADTREDLMMGALFDGPPKLGETALDPALYVKEGVQKLTRAKIAYVNWNAISEILRGLGFPSMPQTLTPELSEAILSHAGFAKPMPGEPADAYAQEFRTLYSARYGGHFLGNNFGSGRNGASGVVDIKGIGKTALVRPWANGNHANGTMTLSECMKEAIWSNILHEELPLGANRVLFIITTGTNVDGNPADGIPRAILVREDPMRPAYFQQNDSVKQTLMADALREMHTAADRTRMEKLLPRLIDALPKPADLPSRLSSAQILTAGFYEMADRVSRQYAVAYVKQILLSGVSTSNVEISGRALDYGATTAVIGYPRAQYLTMEAPNGSPESLKSDLILEFARDLRETLPPTLKAAIPSDEDLNNRVDRQFALNVTQAFLELAGTPREYSARMAKTDSGRKLAETIKSLAEAGNDATIPWSYNMARTGKYNLERVLNALLAKASGVQSDEYNDEYNKALPDPRLQYQLSWQFTLYLEDLTRMSLPDMVPSPALLQYMKLAAEARNRSLYQLRWGNRLDDEFKDVAKRFAQDQTIVQKYTERTVAKNTREMKAAPFQLAVTDGSQLAKGISQQKIFDLKRGRTSTVAVTLPGYFQGPKAVTKPLPAVTRCEARLQTDPVQALLHPVN